MFKRWDRVTIKQAERGRYLRDAFRGESGVVSDVTESIFVGGTYVFIVELDSSDQVCVTEEYLELEKESKDD
jgi:hypothetical protein